MHSMGWAIFSSRRIVPPMIWNMEPGTSGVTGPWVMSRETMRCQEEKLPAVVRAWLSSLCRASLTSFGPMVAALGGTQEQSPDWPKTPCREFWAMVRGCSVTIFAPCYRYSSMVKQMRFRQLTRNMLMRLASGM